MTPEVALPFRIGVSLLVVSAVGIQFHFGRKGAGKVWSTYKFTRDAAEREGRWVLFGQTLSFAVVVLWLIAYDANPHWVAALRAPLGTAWRVAGLGLGFASVVALFAVHLRLGRNWTPLLKLRDDHRLVTSGIYQCVRHPMYAVIFIYMAALGTASGDWLVLSMCALRIALMYVRIGREEALLIERFGDEYRRYMQSTPRLLPRLGRRQPQA